MNYHIEEEPNFDDESTELTYRQHPAIANSDLKYLHSPRLFQLNKSQQLIREETPAFQFGTFIDDYFLSDDFEEKYMLQEEMNTPSHPNQHKFVGLIEAHEGELDDDKIAEYYSQCYSSPNKKKAIELYESLIDYMDFRKRSVGKLLYSPDDYKKALEISRQVAEHKLLYEWLFKEEEDLKNCAVFKHLQITDVPIWGVNWKGEIDKAIIDFDKKIIYNLDLKSTSSPIAYFHYSYKKYYYHRQQALYRRLLMHYLVEKNIIEDIDEYIIKTRIMLVESTPLHEVAAVFVPEEVLLEGEQELKDAAELINYYNKNGWYDRKSYVENNYCEVYNWSEVFDNL